LRYNYDDPQGALRLTNGNLSGFTAARGAFWIDPETLDLLKIDIEGYAIPSNLAVRSISDSTMYLRVLIGKRLVLLPLLRCTAKEEICAVHRYAEFLLMADDEHAVLFGLRVRRTVGELRIT
jgi:hypothetical protein